MSCCSPTIPTPPAARPSTSSPQRSGARVVVAQLPFPCRDDEELIAPMLSAVSPRTRLALLDHVTSPTALDPAGRALGAGARGARASIPWWTARMPPAWCRSPCRTSARPTTPATHISGYAPRRAPPSCTCAATGRQTCTRMSSAMDTLRAFAPSSTGPEPSIPRRGCASPRRCASWAPFCPVAGRHVMSANRNAGAASPRSVPGQHRNRCALPANP